MIFNYWNSNHGRDAVCFVTAVLKKNGPGNPGPFLTTQQFFGKCWGLLCGDGEVDLVHDIQSLRCVVAVRGG